MGISDTIAGFINELLEQTEGCAELQRADLASKFGCVPSQINYVISTRFSPEHGYIVESRRGGGGYIRIQRVRLDPEQLVMHAVNTIGDEIGWPCVRAFLSNLLGSGVVDQDTAELMAAALGDNALRSIPVSVRDSIRADIFKQMLIQLLRT